MHPQQLDTDGAIIDISRQNPVTHDDIMQDYLVRTSVLQGFRETVSQLGLEPEPLLARFGFSGVDPDSETWVSNRAWLELLEYTAEVTANPTFGLLLSTRQDIAVLGSVGIIMQQAPDVRCALRELGQYYNHHNQGATVGISVENGILRWTFTPKPKQGLRFRQQCELAAGIGVNIMRLLMPEWKPIAIYLPHSSPEDTRLYRDLFDCPVHFDWDATIIASDAKCLNVPLQQANPQLHRLLENHISQLREGFPDDFPGQVCHLIRQAMQTGDCSIERVSAYLAVNKRTLQRKLRSAGTSYRQLLDEVRFEMACNFLRESEGQLTGLAHMLCYSELSAFTNAFRRRFGVSPSQWQKRAALTSDIPLP